MESFCILYSVLTEIMSVEQSDGLFPARSFLEVCRWAQMKECNPARVGGWRGGGGSLPSTTAEACTFSELSLYFHATVLCDAEHQFLFLGPQFYHLHFISHTGSCTNNDWQCCCWAEFKSCPYTNAHVADLLRSSYLPVEDKWPQLTRFAQLHVYSSDHIQPICIIPFSRQN